jgi:hypothetical protein
MFGGPARPPRFKYPPGHGLDPRKRKETAKRHYRTNKEKEKQRTKEYANRPERIDRTRELRRKYKRAARIKNLERGLTTNGTPRKAKAADIECIKDRLAVENGRQAWSYWLDLRSPTWWREAYQAVLDEVTRLKRRTYEANKRATDPRYRLKISIRRWARKHLRSDSRRRGSRKWAAILGYTPEQLRDHIESQFAAGMTWENWGTEWEVDHIKAVRLHNFTSIDDAEFKQAFALDNHQPLWIEDHKKKTRNDGRLIRQRRDDNA